MNFPGVNRTAAALSSLSFIMRIQSLAGLLIERNASRQKVGVKAPDRSSVLWIAVPFVFSGEDPWQLAYVAAAWPARLLP